jgi:hypothetical protein
MKHNPSIMNGLQYFVGSADVYLKIGFDFIYFKIHALRKPKLGKNC